MTSQTFVLCSKADEIRVRKRCKYRFVLARSRALRACVVSARRNCARARATREREKGNAFRSASKAGNCVLYQYRVSMRRTFPIERSNEYRNFVVSAARLPRSHARVLPLPRITATLFLLRAALLCSLQFSAHVTATPYNDSVCCYRKTRVGFSYGATYRRFPAEERKRY